MEGVLGGGLENENENENVGIWGDGGRENQGRGKKASRTENREKGNLAVQQTRPNLHLFFFFFFLFFLVFPLSPPLSQSNIQFPHHSQVIAKTIQQTSTSRKGTTGPSFSLCSFSPPFLIIQFSCSAAQLVAPGVESVAGNPGMRDACIARFW